MPRPFSLHRSKNGNRHMATTPSPLRHASNASSISEDSIQGDAENLSPSPSPIKTSIDVTRRRVTSGQKRALRETSPSKDSPHQDYHYAHNENTSPRQSKNRRPSLKELAQQPSASPPSSYPPNAIAETNQKSTHILMDSHNYNYSRQTGHDEQTSKLSRGLSKSEKSEPVARQDFSMALGRSDSKRGHSRSHTVTLEHGSDGYTSPSVNIIHSAELEELGKSSNKHFKTLSKFAKENGEEDFSFAPTPEKAVVGFSDRQRLQRTMSARAKKTSTVPGYGGKIWMDKQRQFLQAYEYLCHIGEAKEWIEGVIEKPIPPIVQLEEALRDGVTLAEIVQAMHPEKTLRVFHNPKLQFRHSDNIAHFFRFLAEIELPELFRFELVDLYDKKNIPKVIYCIHALSWLLYRKGMVDFRIGNLVGELEFAHDELEATQKGLDKAGVSMPNFSSVQDKFVEPEETEEELQGKELAASESAITDFQNQIRGALLRLQLTDIMEELWENEDFIIDFQARVRGCMAREVSDYKLQMQDFTQKLQAVVRGHQVRERMQSRAAQWQSSEASIVKLQSLIRARTARKEAHYLRTQANVHHGGIKDLQAAIRGALSRWDLGDQHAAILNMEPSIARFQALIRGLQARHGHREVTETAKDMVTDYARVQAHVRGFLGRMRTNQTKMELKAQSASIIEFQAALRAYQARDHVADILEGLDQCDEPVLKLQSAIRGFNVRQGTNRDIKCIKDTNPQVSRLHGLIKGALLRQQIGDLLDDLNDHEDMIVEFQGLVRAMLLRNRIMDQLEALDDADDIIVELQAFIQGMLVRQKFAEKQKHYNEQIQKVVKVQSYVRARQQGKQYESLTKGKNPPVGTVKNFVHLLNDNNFDFEVEMESEKLQKVHLQRRKENDQIEQEITELDAMIGLLAHTKIATDEINRFKKQHGGHAGTLLSRDSSVRDSFNLKSLNKNSRAKLELYQELFFILQTQPQYLSRVFRRIRERGATEADLKLDSLIIGTFGHVQKRREEYYFLKLIVRSMKEEAQTCTTVQEFLRGNFFFAKLFGMYSQEARDRKYLRQTFGRVVKGHIMDNSQLDLESDPLQIYRAILSNEELRTGQRSHKNPDLPREEAIKDPHTRETFVRHLQDLREAVDVVLDSLDESLQRMPYGTRYVAQQMYEVLCSQFPDEPNEAMVEIVGNWVWKNYLRPGFAEPESTGVVDRALETKERRNIAEANTVMSQICKGQLFGNENVYLQPLNSYVNEAIVRVYDIWIRLIRAQSIEEQFDLSEFNDLYAKVRPTLIIKLPDVFAMHRIIANEQAALCLTPEDHVLRDVIRDLGSVKSNEAEMSSGTAEVTLQLSTKAHNIEDPDAEIKARFMEAKRCILYIIRIQSGATLWDIMVKPISEEDEERWAALVQEELAAGGQKLRAYSDITSSNNHNLIDIASMSYGELKAVALENIVFLEDAGRIKRDNHFQDILNEIAVDIRNKHRRRLQRQRELDTIRSNISNLEEKRRWLEEKRKAYNDTFEQNLTVLQTKKGKKRFIMPFSKQFNHERELARLGRTPKFGSWKYSAENLASKGIVVSWSGQDLRGSDLTISSDEVNNFVIEGSRGSLIIPGACAEFTWDELLHAQYEGRDIVEFFGDRPADPEGDSAGSKGGASRRPGRSNQCVLCLDRRAFMQWLSKKFWPE